jgi:hypothetical protein
MGDEQTGCWDGGLGCWASRHADASGGSDLEARQAPVGDPLGRGDDVGLALTTASAGHVLCLSPAYPQPCRQPSSLRRGIPACVAGCVKRACRRRSAAAAGPRARESEDSEGRSGLSDGLVLGEDREEGEVVDDLAPAPHQGQTRNNWRPFQAPLIGPSSTASLYRGLQLGDPAAARGADIRGGCALLELELVHAGV